MLLRIVLVGAGKVGYSVASSLSADGHEITVIECDEERADRVDNELDVKVIRGNGVRPAVLERAGITAGECDVSLLIACTNKDEVNVMACWIAKQMGVPHVIARAVGLEFTDNDTWAKNLGIDMLISPERAASKELEELLDVRSAIHATEVAGGKAGIYVFKIETGSPAEGLDLRSFRHKYRSLTILLACVQRGGHAFVPKADDVFEGGDICYTICYRAQVHEVSALFRTDADKHLRKVFIVGAGKIGYQTAVRLLSRERGIKITMFDEDKEKCERVAAELPEILMLCGDGADADLLISEGISEADGFVASTGQDETNLMLAVLAKTLGAAKSIAVVKRSNYMGMTNYIPVDAIINRNQTLADVIIRSVRYPGSSRLIAVMDEINAEALEVVIPVDSPATDKNLAKLHMPSGSIIGLLERGNEIFIPSAKTFLTEGDKVLVFASSDVMPAALKKLGATGK